ncbi:MAG: inorganic phosphate transporter [Candidatus Verstraetearchaeota archaeon]|nr:inorganic phosphate transporter [Candidatus Verstraetearchaeota archaeon]
MSLLLIALTAITLGMAGANNASNSAGTVAGSKIMSYRNGILIFAAGLTLGAVLEGGKLSGAIQGRALAGGLGTDSLQIIMGVTFAMILIATAARLPLPITQAIFGASIGSGLYLGVPLHLDNVMIVLASWALTPFLAAAVSLVLSKVLHRYTINSVGGTVVIYGILTILASLYTAYAFGANTLGLIIGVIREDLGWSVSLATAVIAASLGGIILGERVSRTVGEGVSSLGPPTAFASQVGGALTVHMFTQGGIPVSISHAIIGGVSGSGLAKGAKALSRETAVKLVILWSTTPVFSLIMAWLLHAVILV